MFRIIRRTPWIAAGAAAVYLMDPANGPARRRDVADRIRCGADRLKQQWRGITTGEDASGSGPVPERDHTPLASEDAVVPPVDPSTPIRSGARGAA